MTVFIIILYLQCAISHHCKCVISFIITCLTKKCHSSLKSLLNFIKVLKCSISLTRSHRSFKYFSRGHMSLLFTQITNKSPLYILQYVGYFYKHFKYIKLIDVKIELTRNLTWLSKHVNCIGGVVFQFQLSFKVCSGENARNV